MRSKILDMENTNTVPTIETTRYAVIAYTDGDDTFDTPRVVKFSELDQLRKDADRATDGNIVLAVLHTFKLKVA